MQPGQRPDSLDSQLVFRVYAGITIAAGVFAYLWPMRLGTWAGFPTPDLPGLPWGRLAIIRSAAACVIAFGCCAAAFSAVAEPYSRRRALLHFSLIHLVLVALIWIQWRQVLPAAAIPAVGMVALLLLYAALTSDALEARETAHRVISLFDRPLTPAADPLRSQYAEQIAAATRQEERARLARELHDAVKQQLFVIQTSTATAQTRFDADAPGAKAALDRVRTATRQAITEMETMLRQLQAAPLGHAGFVSALTAETDSLRFRTGAAVALEADPLPPTWTLPPGAVQGLFRIAQEALSNIARHARANHVSITVSVVAGSLALTIRDDGVGFDPSTARSGIGMSSMETRAAELNGTFECTSRPGAGTMIRFTMPYETATAREYRRKAIVWFAITTGLVALAGIGAALGGGYMRTEVMWLPLTSINAVRYLAAFLRLRRLEATA